MQLIDVICLNFLHSLNWVFPCCHSNGQLVWNEDTITLSQPIEVFVVVVNEAICSLWVLVLLWIVGAWTVESWPANGTCYACWNTTDSTVCSMLLHFHRIPMLCKEIQITQGFTSIGISQHILELLNGHIGISFYDPLQRRTQQFSWASLVTWSLFGCNSHFGISPGYLHCFRL